MLVVLLRCCACVVFLFYVRWCVSEWMHCGRLRATIRQHVVVTLVVLDDDVCACVRGGERVHKQQQQQTDGNACPSPYNARRRSPIILIIGDTPIITDILIDRQHYLSFNKFVTFQQAGRQAGRSL